MEVDAFLTRLCEIPGIGKWTAQYVSMRALGEPDAFPSGDLGLLRALDLGSSRELEQRAEAWRPWRAYAAMHLWNIAGDYGVRASKRAPSSRVPVEGTSSRQRAPNGCVTTSGGLEESNYDDKITNVALEGADHGK